MRTYFTLLLLLFIVNTNAQHIEFPLDTNVVTIDGVMNPSEWDKAETIMIGVNTADDVQVKFKHDNTAMYFAFSGKLESANALFPEVLMDPMNVGGSSWSVGQWWFHVSATDCENDTTYGSYSNCMATQPGWTAEPNFSAGAPMTDTVEIRIPFSKVGFSIATMDTIGMVMMVTNTATAFHTYPGSADKDVPSTWMKATFSEYHVAINDVILHPSINIYPNPARDVIYITGAVINSTVAIADLTGRILLKDLVRAKDHSISVGDLPKGTYLLTISDSKGHNYQKFTKL